MIVGNGGKQRQQKHSNTENSLQCVTEAVKQMI